MNHNSKRVTTEQQDRIILQVSIFQYNVPWNPRATFVFENKTCLKHMHCIQENYVIVPQISYHTNCFILELYIENDLRKYKIHMSDTKRYRNAGNLGIEKISFDYN